ncbi:hypothetical protein JD844_019398 [Phrynosoma platyrhinos]|uniref:WAP domain-containing protein n=1 Tax=Phrynosoma platyrhinos TaxID=52577 RepID=A0ABQ7SPT2_PHRPL|nr:hypothetical protein JD844_019398 [Phrynosoma platyrhinos]
MQHKVMEPSSLQGNNSPGQFEAHWVISQAFVQNKLHSVLQKHSLLEKPDMCPTPRGQPTGLCWNWCLNDDDCRGEWKCCPNRCGRSCRYPVESGK